MEFQKKRKIRKWLKEKWGWLLGTGLFLGAGIILLLVGFYLTGWSIIDWLKSPYATTFFILFAIGVYLIIVLVIKSKQSHLGE